VLDEAAARWAPEQAKARAFRRSPSWEKNETVLKRSSFNRVERLSVAYIRKTPLDDLIGRAYSMSVTSPAVLGEHRAAFEHDLRVGLLRLQPSGRFEEAVKAEALLAWRPRET
ncbi:MAG: class I SAM-dependent methyltransferase, partial [Candidatus Binataceae bacterium]